MIGCEIKRVDLSYKGTFQAPQFALMASAARSFQALHSRLGRYGLKLTDIRVEGTATTPADFAISCSLLQFNAVLKVRLESIELNAFAPPSSAPFQDIVAEGLEAVREISSASFKPLISHQAAFELHALLAGQAAKDYLRGYVKDIPWEDSGQVGVSVAFNLGEDRVTSRFSASVVASQSALIPDGLYVQVNATYQGALTIADFAGKFLSLVPESLTRLRLQAKGGEF